MDSTLDRINKLEKGVDSLKDVIKNLKEKNVKLSSELELSKKLNNLLIKQSEEKEKEVNSNENPSSLLKRVEDLERELEYYNVTFGYPEQPNPKIEIKDFDGFINSKKTVTKEIGYLSYKLYCRLYPSSDEDNKIRIGLGMIFNSIHNFKSYFPFNKIIRIEYFNPEIPKEVRETIVVNCPSHNAFKYQELTPEKKFGEELSFDTLLTTKNLRHLGYIRNNMLTFRFTFIEIRL